MIKVRLADIKDIPDIVSLLHTVQKEKSVGQDQIIDNDSFAEYLMECIFSGGIYTFVAVDDEEIVGLLVLNEVTCPWNFNYVYGADLLFVALKGGPKLIRTAKKLGCKKNWKKVYFSTSMNNERADKFFKRIAKPIGGTYEMELD